MKPRTKVKLRRCLRHWPSFVVIVLLPFAIAGLVLALFPPCWAWVSMLDMRSWSLQVWFGVVAALGIVLLWMRSFPKKSG